MDQKGYYTFGNPSSSLVFIQPVNDHDSQMMEKEASFLSDQADNADWCIAAVPVADWNRDLTPWAADPVFGNLSFGAGASETLEHLTAHIIPEIEKEYSHAYRRYILCGYSLAGLFSLWAAYQTDMFDGVIAASPSVWYPGWLPYAEKRQLRARYVYLSLGDREERTKNPVMASVGQNIRLMHEVLAERGTTCQLDWNPGNHFVNSDQRMARGMAWMLNAMGENC